MELLRQGKAVVDREGQGEGDQEKDDCGFYRNGSNRMVDVTR